MRQKLLMGKWLLLPAFALALILVFRSGDSNLIRQARRVATFDAVLDSHCLWSSDHTGIYMRYRQDDSGFELAQIDTDTGKVTPMEPLNRKYNALMQWPGPRMKAFNMQGERIWHRIPLVNISPDGKWIVFCTPNVRIADRTVPGGYIAMTLDGTQEARWEAGTLYARAPFWLPQGHRWLEPIFELKGGMMLTGLILHDTDHPEENQSLPVLGAAGGLGIFGITAADQLACTEMFRYGTDASTSPVEYVTYDVPGLSTCNSPGRLGRYQVNLPEGVSYVDCALSPQGDRMAWHMVVRHSSWIDRLFHRFSPSTPLRFEEREEIWVSHLDGSHMNEIGDNVLSAKGNTARLFQMQWLPGGKQLSFLYRDGIYTVPAP